MLIVVVIEPGVPSKDLIGLVHGPRYKLAVKLH
jgi:hypothetical protein